MAVRFEGTSAGVKGTTYTVQVHDSDFAGTKVDVSLGGDGFRLSYEPEEDSPDVAIIPSTLSFSIIRTSENAAAFNSFLSDFATTDEGRFTVRILSGSNLYWCGYLLADQVRYLDTRWADTNAEFAMKAKDGINRLKGINYNDDGTAYEGRVTFKEHLFNILDKIGLQDFWGATDDYLHSVVRWYEEDDTIATLNDNSIDRVYGDHRAAYEVGDNGTYVYKSSFEILEAICTTFGARFFQSDGKWHFIQFNEFRQTGSIYLHRYYKDGTKPGTSSSVDFEVDETGGDFITASEGVQFFIPPVGRVEVEFKHKDDRNYLQGETIVFEVDSTIPGVPGNNSKYRISGLFTSDVEFTNNHLPVFNVVGLKIEIRDQSANVYRLERIAEITGGTNINYSDTQWVEDGLNEYQIVMPIQQSGLPVTQSFDFVTPDSPAGTDSATLLITYFDNRQVVIGNIFNTAVDTVTISASGLSFQAMNTNGTFPAASNLLTLTNPDTPGASAVVSKEVIFSDRINFTSSGSITRLVGDEHINTLSWSKGLSGTNYPIRRLLAIELLYQRRKAIKSIDATFISINDFHFFNLLKLNTGEQYVPIRATYNSKREDWAGRYFSIGYSDTLTGVTVINDVPLGPNGQPGGGGTPPGEGPITIPGVSANNPIGSSFDDGGHIISTTGDSSYSDGDEVTTIGIDTATVDGLVQAGDTIAMIDRTTGNTQTFTVTSNLQAGYTTIAISSATISGSFGTNSYITLGTGEFVTNIRQGANNTDFRIVVKTDNAGTSNNDQFQFTGAVGNYDVQVYDSTGTTLQETITGLSGAATITIAAGAGTYELRVLPAETSGFNRIQFNNGGDKGKLLEVRNWGDIVWSNMNNSFYGCANLTSITSFVAPDLSVATRFGQFVRDCSNLTTLDVSNWNTANVTSFGLFAFGCSSLLTLDVSNWNTANVTNFTYFVLGCSSLLTLDVSNWNTANVTTFLGFAQGASSLTDIIGIENFTISSVTNFQFFIAGVTLPTSRYDQLLINYEAQAPNTGLSFHGGNSKFTAGGAAEAARTSLATTYLWTIADGGPV